MRVCERYRVPLSEFRSWSFDDRAHALAVERNRMAAAAERAEWACPSCHQLFHDFVDPETKRDRPVSEWPVHAVVRSCRACEMLHEAEKDAKRGYAGKALPSWRRPQLVPGPPPETL